MNQKIKEQDPFEPLPGETVESLYDVLHDAQKHVFWRSRQFLELGFKVEMGYRGKMPRYKKIFSNTSVEAASAEELNSLRERLWYAGDGLGLLAVESERMSNYFRTAHIAIEKMQSLLEQKEKEKRALALEVKSEVAG